MTRRALFGLIAPLLFWRKPKPVESHDVVHDWTWEAHRAPEEAVCVTEWWVRSEAGAEVVYRAAAPGCVPLFWRRTVDWWPFVGMRSDPQVTEVEFEKHMTKEQLSRRYGDVTVLHPQSLDVTNMTVVEDMTKEEFARRYPSRTQTHAD